VYIYILQINFYKKKKKKKRGNSIGDFLRAKNVTKIFDRYFYSVFSYFRRRGSEVDVLTGMRTACLKNLVQNRAGSRFISPQTGKQTSLLFIGYLGVNLPDPDAGR
jgi:signal transduction histidine kinase